MHEAVQAEYHESWTFKQIAFVRRQYDKLSSAVQRHADELDGAKIRRESTPTSASLIAPSLDPDQTFENQAFIASSTASLREEQPINTIAERPPLQQTPLQSTKQVATTTGERLLALPSQRPLQQLRDTRSPIHQKENAERSAYDNSEPYD